MAAYVHNARAPIELTVNGKTVKVAPGEPVDLSDADVERLGAFMRAGVFQRVSEPAAPAPAPPPQPDPPITSVVTVPETPKARRRRRRATP